MFGRGKQDKNKQLGNQDYYSCFHTESVAAGVWQGTSPLIWSLINPLQLNSPIKSPVRIVASGCFLARELLIPKSPVAAPWQAAARRHKNPLWPDFFMPVYVSPPVSGRAWSWHQTGCRHEPVAALVQRVASALRTVHRLLAARVQQ